MSPRFQARETSERKRWPSASSVINPRSGDAASSGHKTRFTMIGAGITFGIASSKDRSTSFSATRGLFTRYTERPYDFMRSSGLSEALVPETILLVRPELPVNLNGQSRCSGGKVYQRSGHGSWKSVQRWEHGVRLRELLDRRHGEDMARPSMEAVLPGHLRLREHDRDHRARGLERLQRPK